MAAADISRTNGTATNNLKWTYSAWLKRGVLGTNQAIATTRTGTSGPYTNIIINNSDRINIYGPNTSSLNDYNYQTTRYFRDVGAWYHLVVAFDCTLAAAGDRLRIYINGVEETSFVTETNPTQNNTYTMNYTGYTFMVGARTDDSEYWTGDMSHVQFVDGLQLTPTEFGETDSTSGIWKIKVDAYGTPGNNGFFLKMEDRTNLDLDSSSNAHTMTTSGTLTATYDNPSNNFCTMNPLDNYYQSATFSNGNNTTLIATAVACYSTGTLGMTAGKWYWEIRGTTNTGGFQVLPGIAGRLNTSTTEQELGEAVDTYGYYSSNGDSYNNATGTSYGDTFAADDIIGVAVDLDNNKLYFSKNGTWQDSGDPTSGATGTGAISLMAASATFLGAYFPAFTGGWGGSVGHYGQFNFGNGYFGTTAVSSTNADDAGIGSFEYDVPTGYYALCTKNIKAYGG